MKSFALTSATFQSWLKAPPRFSVLMVKHDECIPCGRVFPTYEKYATAWGTEYDIQFATYTIATNDRDFVANTLKVKVTPTFQVYDNGQIVYSLSSASRIGELKNFLLENIPFKELDI